MPMRHYASFKPLPKVLYKSKLSGMFLFNRSDCTLNAVCLLKNSRDTHSKNCQDTPFIDVRIKLETYV
jgi:hypothetical protein